MLCCEWCRASDEMLLKVFKHMLQTENHLGSTKQDKYLTYGVFASLVRRHQEPWNYDASEWLLLSWDLTGADGVKKAYRARTPMELKRELTTEPSGLDRVGKLHEEALKVSGEGEEDYNDNVIKVDRGCRRRVTDRRRKGSLQAVCSRI